ncbi:hypothetical protein ABIA23_006799 [Sinorhizobium fredii]
MRYRDLGRWHLDVETGHLERPVQKEDFGSPIDRRDASTGAVRERQRHVTQVNSSQVVHFDGARLAPTPGYQFVDFAFEDDLAADDTRGNDRGHRACHPKRPAPALAGFLP